MLPVVPNAKLDVPAPISPLKSLALLVETVLSAAILRYVSAPGFVKVNKFCPIVVPPKLPLAVPALEKVLSHSLASVSLESSPSITLLEPVPVSFVAAVPNPKEVLPVPAVNPLLPPSHFKTLVSPASAVDPDVPNVRLLVPAPISPRKSAALLTVIVSFAFILRKLSALTSAIPYNALPIVVVDVTPVPPLASAITVPFHSPVPIVPTVVILLVPPQVDNAVSSTLPNDKSDLVSV